MIIKFKKAKLKSMLLVSLFMIIMSIMVYGLTIQLNTPADGSWWTDPNSVDHNWTVWTNSSLETIEYCTLYSNRTGTQDVLANFTTGFTNNTPFVSGIAWVDTSDTSDVWNVSCANTSIVIDSNNAFELGVDANPPTITLDSPDDNTFTNIDNDLIKYTPTDASNPDTCLFYTNVTTSWAINQTDASYTSGSQITVNLSLNAGNVSISDGVYIWNVLCNDSAANSAWAEDTNRTFTIDTVTPTDISFVSPTNNTVDSDTTPEIKWNQTTEVNFDEYLVSVSTSLTSFTANIIQTQITSTITENATTLSELEANDQYYIMVTAVDKAGNEVNISTGFLWYAVDTTSITVALNTPANNTFTTETTPDFNVTVTDNNPDSCVLYLSNASAESVAKNVTRTGVTSGTEINLTPVTDMIDGFYRWNMECNDSAGNVANVSSSDLDIIIDTTVPQIIFIDSTWHQTNSTDGTPTLSWNQTVDTNFERYLVEARNISDGNIDFEVNITTISTTTTTLDLTFSQTYNFSVTTYDKAGLSNTTSFLNTTDTWYYVDEICASLEPGWNLCGPTWVTSKNLSVIGEETSATFVAVWNESHDWSTCVVGVSVTNCDIDTGVNPTDIGHVWVYVSGETKWRNRTWVATRLDANITLTNITNGWNIIPGEFRNGRNFGDLGRLFGGFNVSMFSLPFINGTVASYVNQDPFSAMDINTTVLNYGKAMWVFYNGTGQRGNLTGNHTFDVGSW